MTDNLTPLDALAAEIADRAAGAREASAAADKAVNNIHDTQVYLDGFDSGYRAAVEAIAQPMAQAGADAIVAELAAKGMLRTPGALKVSRVERDRAGNIKAVITEER